MTRAPSFKLRISGATSCRKAAWMLGCDRPPSSLSDESSAVKSRATPGNCASLSEFSELASALVQTRRVAWPFPFGGAPALRSASGVSPRRTPRSRSWKLASPACLWFCRKQNVFGSSRAHSSASKAQVSPSTGGSCRKSPHITTCSPPNGRESSRSLLRSLEALSNRSPGIMLTSSSSRVFASIMASSARFVAFFHFLRRERRRRVVPSCPQFMNECSVEPPMCTAAAPVDAHTATRRSSTQPSFWHSSCTSLSSRKLFPEPGSPVMNTEPPAKTARATSACSGQSSARTFSS
mmetsp:Transcript_96439/g.251376  ORF Transcript_96439/g.251376 Transcript_96439/m.251376 type:complete len:294 (-) Transcript_96439:54-935(-)